MSLAEVLETPGISEQFMPLSVEAYHLLGEAGLIPEKTELIEGVIIHKMPKSPLHRTLLLRLFKRLQQAIAVGFTVWPEQPISAGHSEPEPDLAVIAGKDDDYQIKHPATAELVIEVAMSSHELDRRKAGIYAAMGVKEYWIVLAPERAIEIYRRPGKDAYGEKITIAAGETAASTAVPAFRVNVDELFRA